MTDKQLHSLGKVQLLKMIHQQEMEIEKLTAENENLRSRLREHPPHDHERFVSADTVRGELIRAAGDADDENVYGDLDPVYVRAAIERLERKAMEKAEAMISEAEQKRADIEAKERENVWKLRRILDIYTEQLIKTHAGVHEMIREIHIGVQPLVGSFASQTYDDSAESGNKNSNDS